MIFFPVFIFNSLDLNECKYMKHIECKNMKHIVWISAVAGKKEGLN